MTRDEQRPEPPLKWAIGDRCRWGATTYRIGDILQKGTRMRDGTVLKHSLARLDPIKPEIIWARLSSLDIATSPSEDTER